MSCFPGLERSSISSLPEWRAVVPGCRCCSRGASRREKSKVTSSARCSQCDRAQGRTLLLWSGIEYVFLRHDRISVPHYSVPVLLSPSTSHTAAFVRMPSQGRVECLHHSRTDAGGGRHGRLRIRPGSWSVAPRSGAISAVAQACSTLGIEHVHASVDMAPTASYSNMMRGIARRMPSPTLEPGSG